VLVAADLTAWRQTTVLARESDLARAEPKALRYRLLHTAARITRGGRRIFLNLARTWPWTAAIINAFARLRLVPVPI
jgi:Transposase DDE domain group 1